MSVLRLPCAICDDLRAHSEETYPSECCGALLGRATSDGWQIVSHVRAENARAGEARNRYEIAPVELVGITRLAHRHGLEIAGFYHSHPDHPAEPSATDLAEAHWLGCLYVITEVANGKAAATNAYLLAGAGEENKYFERKTVEIEGGDPGPGLA